MTDGYPAWMIIVERDTSSMEINHRYGPWKILKVLPVDLADERELQLIYDRELTPLYATNRQIQHLFFYREPDNPFRATGLTMKEYVGHGDPLDPATW